MPDPRDREAEPGVALEPNTPVFLPGHIAIAASVVEDVRVGIERASNLAQADLMGSATKAHARGESVAADDMTRAAGAIVANLNAVLAALPAPKGG